MFEIKKNTLLKKLFANPDLFKKVAAIHPELLKQSDRPHVESLNSEIRQYLGGESGEWDKLFPELLDACSYGVPRGPNIIASMMAVGCSLHFKKHNSNLFSPRLRQMCKEHITMKHNTKRDNFNKRVKEQAYQNWCERGKPKGDEWTDWFYAKKVINDEHLFLDKCHKLYTSICTDPDHKISLNLQRMLKEDSNPSRAGRALNKLDVVTLKAAYENLFVPNESMTPTSPYPDTVRGPEVTASSSLSITLDNFTCKKMNDREKDSIVWSGCLIQLKDLKSIYDKIDMAVRTRQQEHLHLESEFAISAFSSSVFKDFDLNKQVTMGIDLPKIRIYNGYSPWILLATCTEIDSGKHEHVLDWIQKGADGVSVLGVPVRVDGFLTAVTWATVAGAVLAATGSIVLAAVGAMCMIGDYFNDDDIIGNIEINSLTDYSGVTSSSSKTSTHTAAGNKDGEYDLQVSFTYSESVHKYRRNWATGRTRKQFSDWKEHDPLGFWGGNGEDDLWCPLNGNGNIIRIFNWGTEGYTHSKLRHAEWIGGSELVREPHPSGIPFQLAKGKCHWGVRGRHSIRYRAWVVGEYLREEV